MINIMDINDGHREKNTHPAFAPFSHEVARFSKGSPLYICFSMIIPFVHL